MTEAILLMTDYQLQNIGGVGDEVSKGFFRTVSGVAGGLGALGCLR